MKFKLNRMGSVPRRAPSNWLTPSALSTWFLLFPETRCLFPWKLKIFTEFTAIRPLILLLAKFVASSVRPFFPNLFFWFIVPFRTVVGFFSSSTFSFASNCLCSKWRNQGQIAIPSYWIRFAHRQGRQRKRCIRPRKINNAKRYL